MYCTRFGWLKGVVDGSIFADFLPLFQWVWAGPAIALFAQTAIFYWRHRHIDDEIYMLEQETPQSQVAIDEKEEEARA